MAGTIVHLAVAQKILSILLELDWEYSFDSSLQISKDYFIAGNICPDGIMARKNYERSMKLHSHFRDGIPDGSFDKEGMVELFEKRMHDFWIEHQEDEKRCPGLYLGYITHMMVDERFVLEIRPKFFENISVIGLTERDRETFVHFNEETDLVDFELLHDFPMLQEAKEALERVPEYEIKGMITKEELSDSRKWILQYFFYTEHTGKRSQYLKYETMVNFIEGISKEIVMRLFAEDFLRCRKR